MAAEAADRPRSIKIGGIDPGKSGAIALIDPESELVEIHDMPTFRVRGREELDEVVLGRLLAETGVRMWFVEQVSAMPKNGAVSMFTFGRVYGTIRGIISAHRIPVEYVTPPVWKKEMGVTKDKDGARARASQLLPRCAERWSAKSHDGRAEAALIALYGCRVLGVNPGNPELRE